MTDAKTYTVNHRLEGLRELLAKVEAGKDITRTSEFVNAFEPVLGYDAAINAAGWSWRAYTGSLDAAKALHEAVLPEWGWGKYYNGDVYVSERGPMVSSFTATANTPARAWLIAILRALISMEEEG